MTTPFIFEKCILCLKNPADSLEHIIPDCIGGRLKYKILCKHCNNTLGAVLMSKVKTDPSIRMAVYHLKNEIPKIFDKVENGQIYSATDKNDNKIFLRYRNGNAEVKSHEKEDGSLIHHTAYASKHLKRLLEKEKLASDEIETKIELFKKLGNNEKVPLAGGISVAKWSIDQDSILPVLDDPFLDDKIPALISYEFLSLIICNVIYDSGLDFIRDFIRKGISSKSLVVEWLMSKDYGSFHKIYLELAKDETVVNIVLFGKLVYRVRIKGLVLSFPEFIYYEDLKGKKSAIAKSIEEAKQGNYYLF